MTYTICILCAGNGEVAMFWSDVMLVAFLSVTEVAYCFVKYIVGLVFHEKGLVAQAE
jgi:hypothetical protein